MKVKLAANAELDLLTAGEVADVLATARTAWTAELARGVRFRRPSMQGIVTAGGTLRIGGGQSASGYDGGPAEGMMWSVSRVTVRGLTAAQTAQLYLNDVSDLLVVGTFGSGVPAQLANQILYGERGLVLNSDDKLIVDGTGLTAGATITVALGVAELPVQLAWQLL
jgi:hypothetical protein